MRVLIITGMSGSGKSTALKALEDVGYYCIDNLPVRLFRQFVELIDKSGEQFKGVALVSDIRGRDFSDGVVDTLSELRTCGHQLEVLFFDATDEALIQRFSETRRRHPADENCTIPEGIRIERERLGLLRHLATSIIDTSEFNVHKLRETVLMTISGEKIDTCFTVDLVSFGFRYGVPLDANMVMDVRFLDNPHFIPELRPKTGLDDRVREYVCAKPETVTFLEQFQKMLEFLLPLYRREGKSYLTIAIGCTGGRHRSVSIVEVLAQRLQNQEVKLRVGHRDIEKG